jgi:hypothetical protein
LVHPHEPLVGEIGLDHLTGAIAARHLQLVLLLLDQQAGGFQIREHDLARDPIPKADPGRDTFRGIGR